ncbi:MAG: fatty acid desaturase, partial [Pseudomonadota bacterium]
MTSSLTFDRRQAEARPVPAIPVSERPVSERIADDKAMLRTAADLTRDLNVPKPAIYWADLLVSAAVGYAALFAAMMPGLGGWAVAAFVVAIFALYRAGSFIHELTHIKHSAVPGFRLVWNLLAGIPLMAPSFMYEGVHNLHHARTRYGTAEDPEYLPLALMKPWSVPLFVLVSLLAPVALIFRFAVLAPLSLLIPSLRTRVVAQYSALSINPAFRRRPPEGEARMLWLWIEAAASVWSISLIVMVATGVIPLRAFLIFIAAISVGAVINQVRTLVAHLWENEGEAMTVTAQYLDTVNVPPPALLPMLWA